MEDALVHAGFAVWTDHSGKVVVAAEVENTGSETIVIGSVGAIDGFGEVQSGILVGADGDWVERPAGLRPLPQELMPGELARVFLYLQVLDCDEIGQWEPGGGGIVQFSANSGEPATIDVWWANQAEQRVTFPFDVTPALQVPSVERSVCE